MHRIEQHLLLNLSLTLHNRLISRRRLLVRLFRNLGNLFSPVHSLNFQHLLFVLLSTKISHIQVLSQILESKQRQLLTNVLHLVNELSEVDDKLEIQPHLNVRLLFFLNFLYFISPILFTLNYLDRRLLFYFFSNTMSNFLFQSYFK